MPSTPRFPRPGCIAGLAAGARRFKAPYVVRQRSLSPHQLQRPAGIVDDRLDLPAVADDPGVAEQALDIALVETGDPLEVEAGEGVRKAGRLRRIVSQERPAWKPSKLSFSNSRTSSATGKPHSGSW